MRPTRDARLNSHIESSSEARQSFGEGNSKDPQSRGGVHQIDTLYHCYFKSEGYSSVGECTQSATGLEVLVKLLVCLSNAVLGITTKEISWPSTTYDRGHVCVPRGLLFAVASHGADDGILLPGYTVRSALGVPSSLAGGNLSFASLQGEEVSTQPQSSRPRQGKKSNRTYRVLLLAALLPRLGTSEVAECLDDGALDGVVLAGGLGGGVVRVGGGGVGGHDSE
jgi:hypothetical protein